MSRVEKGGYSIISFAHPILVPEDVGEHPALHLAGVGVISINLATIQQLVTQPTNHQIGWYTFCSMPIVSVTITRQDRKAFEYLLSVQRPNLMYSDFISPIELVDFCKYGHAVALGEDAKTTILRNSLFLLDYLNPGGPKVDKRIPWLWTAPTDLVEHWQWWYALMQRRWAPTCAFTAEVVSEAYVHARHLWNDQKHQALLLFALLRPALGRDPARLMAEMILNTSML